MAPFEMARVLARDGCIRSGDGHRRRGNWCSGNGSASGGLGDGGELEGKGGAHTGGAIDAD